MENKKETVRSPKVYIETTKGTLLAVLKLIEALLAGYAAYYILTHPSFITDSVTRFFSASFSSADSSAIMMNTMNSLLRNTSNIIVITALVLIVLDGFGVFFLRFTKKGAGLVKLVHTLRYIVSLISILFVFYSIFRYVTTMMDAIKNAQSFGFGDYFRILGSYEMVLTIIILIGTLWVTTDYHLYVRRVMKHIALETKGDMIMPMTKKNHLGRETLWFIIILGLSIVFSIIEIAHIGKVSEWAGFLKPVEILHRGSNAVSLSVAAFVLLKFILVNRCNADFEAAHS